MTGDPARQERLRELNLGLVFREVLAADAPLSRTELAAATGLTRPTITRIVEELLAGRLVTETGTNPDGRAGRPRVGLTLSRTGPAGLGLDIRSDGLAACVVDLAGRVRHLAFAPLTDTDAPAVLERLGRMAAEAVTAAAAEDLTVVTATLAVPGPVDGGIVRTAPALGWRDVPAADLLDAALSGLGLATAVDSEANLAARGELHATGADRALTHFVYVSGGLDIGAGLVMDGRLMRGARGWGGELGHVTVDPEGKPCRCGSRGCLQTYASLPALLGGEVVPAGASPESVILGRADAGRPETLAALDAAASALGVALANVCNLLGVDTVFLGGSFALLDSWLSAGVQAELSQRVLFADWAPVTVRPATIGPDAAAIGAALAVVDRVSADPSAWLAANR
ncbi:ROK family transcriptional regulator [Glycomyces artemisiae]|uniref:Putative NBD/HSP70 family sugar kinase n=1 Tax=Glycomyces artemisiae TaxID=1076443 RepID=A0A2T0UCX5_9ACTN|nr:ROK family transcriptional regulator [Glycomyces artemisiae]PRY55796.1 putative NBD/HSP70 family sugar kinase [Glycomyces artemisiae]